MADLTVNGYDVSGLGFFMARGSAKKNSSRQPVGVRAQGRAGMRKTVALFDEDVRILSIEGDIQGSSAADARTKLDTFSAVVGEGPVQLIFGDQPARFITGEMTGFEAVSYGPEQTATRFNIRVTMLCVDPYFYDTSDTVVTTTTSFAALALGDGVVRPQFKITGAATNPTITVRDDADVTIFQITFPVYSLAGAATVIVNADTMTVLEGATNRIDKCGVLQFPVLDPRIHALYRTSVWPDANVSSGTLEVRYKKAWL